MAINAYFHVTPSGAGAKDGTTWAKAMGLAELETYLEGSVVAGDVFFIKEGTYSFSSNFDWTARDGTSVSPIALFGVLSGTTHEGANVVYTDWATGLNRPFFDLSTYTFKSSDYNIIRNIYFQGEASSAVTTGTPNIVENCKCDQDYGSSASRYILAVGNDNIVLNSEFLSANANGLSTNIRCKVKYCYFHDMTNATGGIALNIGSSGNVVQFNVFNNIRMAVQDTTQISSDISNNTFYETATGIYFTTASGSIVSNNIMEGNNTVGIKWDTQEDFNFFEGNHGDDTRCADMWLNVDTTTVYKDNNVSTGDPKFISTSDFSLATTSPCIGNAYSHSIGISGAGKQNKGAWQNDIDEAARNSGTAAGNILTGNSIKIQNVTTNGTFDESSRNTDPGIANVIKDVSYKIKNSSLVGTFDEAVRNTNPGVGNVKNGTSYKILNSSYVGTLNTSGTGTGGSSDKDYEFRFGF